MGSPGDHCIKTEGLDTRRQVGRERKLGYFQSEYHVKNQNVNIFLFKKNLQIYRQGMMCSCDSNGSRNNF